MFIPSSFILFARIKHLYELVDDICPHLLEDKSQKTNERIFLLLNKDCLAQCAFLKNRCKGYGHPHIQQKQYYLVLQKTYHRYRY